MQLSPVSASTHAACSQGDHTLLTSFTISAADAAAICKDRHTQSTGSAAVGCDESATDGPRSSDGGGAVVLVGTSSGTLHCISCTSGQVLWKMHTGGSISTAAAFCPASRPSAPAGALEAVDPPGLPESLSRTSAATDEQQQTHMGADASVQQHSSSSQQAQMSFRCRLVSFTNQGTVRVLQLPGVAGESLDLNQGLLQPGQSAAKQTQAERQQQSMPSIHAAAQMPGDWPCILPLCCESWRTTNGRTGPNSAICVAMSYRNPLERPFDVV